MTAKQPQQCPEGAVRPKAPSAPPMKGGDKFAKIRKAITAHKEMTDGNIREDGRMRWEYYGVQRRIAQAAYNFNGYIVTGTRHSCPIMQMQMIAIGNDLLDEWCDGDKMVQGFTCQYGLFLTRQEAYVIAKEAGQIIRKDECPGTLYSECYI